MKSVLNLFFARSHSIAYAIVLVLLAVITALTGKILIPLLSALVCCCFVHFIEEVNIDMQKKSK